MFLNTTSKPTKMSALKNSVFRFARDESGNMTIFALSMMGLMLLVGGIGVDLMRNEMERTRVQATLDRAILSAADLDQTLEPEDVVHDYFDKAGMAEYLTSVTVNNNLNVRTVSASARTTTPTQFMRFMGVDELTAPAIGQAEERITNVEISVVLDISGSMRLNGKMDNLKDAASAFVDSVIREETDDLISISMIPYTAQVNAGPDIFNQLAINSNGSHNRSHCIDFDDSDFNSAALNLNKSYQQMQHFEASSNRPTWNPLKVNEATGQLGDWDIVNPGCPQQSYEEITPFSQDADELKDTIEQLQPRANTSIHLGMKWAAAMLDPAFRPVVNSLANDGKVETSFENRPAAYSDPETLKTIILMTDGENVNTVRIQPSFYANLNHQAHWDRFPLYYYLNAARVPSWNSWRFTKYSASQADALLSNVCDAAKNQGVIVWSVGFEVTNDSANVMEDCASSPSHFFRVEGVEISEAFEAIATQINQLRLTQ